MNYATIEYTDSCFAAGEAVCITQSEYGDIITKFKDSQDRTRLGIALEDNILYEGVNKTWVLTRGICTIPVKEYFEKGDSIYVDENGEYCKTETPWKIGLCNKSGDDFVEIRI